MNERLAILRSYLAHRHFRRFRDRASLERYQERATARYLEWLVTASPYYASLHAGSPIREVADLPPMDKATMMEHFSEMNTLGLDRDECLEAALASEASRDFSPTVGGVTVGLSSGTSGNRGLFVASPAERALWAGGILAKMLPGSILGSYRVAFFLRANSNLYETVAGSRIAFDFFDLLRPLDEHVARLAASPPDILIAPPSMLLMLAAEAEAGALRGMVPRKVVSVAEVLEPQDAARIAAAFGQAVTHQVYQATEGFLGCTCSHGTLHLNEDIVRIDREPVPGDPTRFIPIVTDFTRTTQPVARYRLNDMLVLRDAPCPCGSPLLAIERVEGRCDDVLEIPGRKGGPIPLFPDFARRAMMEASSRILSYAVVQGPDGRLRLWADTGDSPPEAVAVARLAAEVAWHRICLDAGGTCPPISWSDEPPSREPGEKLRRVRRLR